MNKIIEILNDGILYFRFPDILTVDVIEQYCAEMDAILAQNDFKFRAVADLTMLSDVPRIEIVQSLGKCMKRHKARKEKSAVLIGKKVSNYAKMGIQATLTLIGRSDIKIFQDIDDAFNYVKS